MFVFFSLESGKREKSKNAWWKPCHWRSPSCCTSRAEGSVNISPASNWNKWSNPMWLREKSRDHSITLSIGEQYDSPQSRCNQRTGTKVFGWLCPATQQQIQTGEHPRQHIAVSCQRHLRNLALWPLRHRQDNHGESVARPYWHSKERSKCPEYGAQSTDGYNKSIRRFLSLCTRSKRSTTYSADQ